MLMCNAVCLYKAQCNWNPNSLSYIAWVLVFWGFFHDFFKFMIVLGFFDT